MKLGFDREKEKHFEETLRHLISDGKMSAGDRLMSAEELSKIFHITPGEVKRVLRRLRKERMLVTFRGRGTYVLESRPLKRMEKTICVITMETTSSSTQKVIHGICDVLTANGYNMEYRDTGNSQSKEEKILKSMLSSKAAGYIIEPSKSQLMCRHMYIYNKMDHENIPYVFIRTNYPQMADRPKVIVDDIQGGYLLTRHMIAAVGDNIVGIFRADSKRGFERHRGYVKALQEAGIPYRPELVIWYHLEEGIKKPTLELASILNTQSCDGIICYDDAMATNIIYYLFSNGFSVPEDIAVAGYGNTAIATAGELGLTTIAQPDELLGEMAAEYILEKLRGSADRESGSERILSPELVIRGSTVGSGI
jgi:GntR family transcriptional regulator of arabinose operon